LPPGGNQLYRLCRFARLVQKHRHFARVGPGSGTVERAGQIVGQNVPGFHGNAPLPVGLEGELAARVAAQIGMWSTVKAVLRVSQNWTSGQTN
jgi:hypothetical protein